MASERIRFGDDGTFDTVLVCNDCGAEARYNYDPADATESLQAADQAYDAWINWAIEDFDSEHEC